MTRYPGRTTAGLGERNQLLNAAIPLPPTLGVPITEHTAIALRQIVFGQCPSIIRSEFFGRGPGMVFREAEQPLSYGLTFTNADMTPMARSVLMVVQAHIIRTLLFETDPSRMLKSRRHPLEPSRMVQKEALCGALADILWRAGGGKSCTLALASKTTYLSASSDYNQDGITEKLQIITFEQQSELISTLRRFIYMFQEEPGAGVILLIYSAILSRGLDQVGEDLCGRPVHFTPAVSDCHLVSFKGNVSNSVLCLLMTGRATAFLHNGVQYRGDEEKTPVAEIGVQVRSSLGLLLWLGNEDKTGAISIGSRLKTPLYPIWLVVAGSEQISSVLFCLDRALMRDYRNEYKFHLHYYTSSHYQHSETVLGVCTRGADDTDPLSQSEQNASSILEKIIRTKWSGARVTWNNHIPFL